MDSRRCDRAPPKWALLSQTPRASVWTRHFVSARVIGVRMPCADFPGSGGRLNSGRGRDSWRTGSEAIDIHESVKGESVSIFCALRMVVGDPFVKCFPAGVPVMRSCLRRSGGPVSCCRAPVWTRRVGRARPEVRALWGPLKSIHPMKRVHHPSPRRCAALASWCSMGALPPLCRPCIAAERRTSSERTFPCT